MLLLLAVLLSTAPEGAATRPADGGTPVVVGSLDKELIREVIHANRDRIRGCYERALSERAFEGKVAVKFTIAPSGEVGSAEVVGDTQNDSLAKCVAAEVLRFKFPKPKGGGSVTVTYPFIFRGSPDAGKAL
jgi:TonB family protein